MTIVEQIANVVQNVVVCGVATTYDCAAAPFKKVDWFNMNAEIHVKRLDDRTLYRIFKDAEQKANQALKDAQAAGTIAGSHHRITLSFTPLIPLGFSEDSLVDAEPGQFTLARVNFAVSGQKDSKTDQVSVALQRATSGLVDKITYNQNSGNAGIWDKSDGSVLEVIRQSLSPIMQPVVQEDGGIIPTLSNLTQSFDTTYQRLSSELSAAVADLQRERVAQLKEIKDERVKLQGEMKVERDALLEDARSVLEQERTQLAAEKAELDELWKKLEVSSHKDARRKQFIQLQEDLKNNLKDPVAGVAQRLMQAGVFLALFGAGTVTSMLALESLNFPATVQDASTSTLLLFGLKGTLLSAATLASFFGAAAWLRYLYTQDMRSKEETRRFRSDMARASWIFDAAVEMKTEHNDVIPNVWIEGVTRGLFESSSKGSLDEGAQALAALMGLSATAKFTPEGAEVALSRKGKKRISEAGESE